MILEIFHMKHYQNTLLKPQKNKWNYAKKRVSVWTPQGECLNAGAAVEPFLGECLKVLPLFCVFNFTLCAFSKYSPTKHAIAIPFALITLNTYIPRKLTKFELAQSWLAPLEVKWIGLSAIMEQNCQPKLVHQQLLITWTRRTVSLLLLLLLLLLLETNILTQCYNGTRLSTWSSASTVQNCQPNLVHQQILITRSGRTVSLLLLLETNILLQWNNLVHGRVRNPSPLTWLQHLDKK